MWFLNTRVKACLPGIQAGFVSSTCLAAQCLNQHPNLDLEAIWQIDFVEPPAVWDSNFSKVAILFTVLNSLLERKEYRPNSSN